MKVAFYYESINLGGQQTQTLNIMRALKQMGHEVVYLYSYGDDLKEEFKAVGPISRLDVHLEDGTYYRSPIKLIRLWWSLRVSLRQQAVDFVVAGSALGALLSGLAVIGLGVKNFWYVGGLPSQVFPTFFRYFRLLNFDALVRGYFGWQACFEELSSIGATRSKFIPIPIAVDTALFKKASTPVVCELRSRLGIPDEALVLGWVGRIAINMQIWDTLEVFNMVSARYAGDVYFLVVGGGPDFELFTRKVNQSEWREKVVLTNWVPFEDVVTYINIMDIVPLLEEDPQGGSILRETMACGRVALSVDGVSGTQRSFMAPGTSVLVSPSNYLNAATDWILENSSRKSLTEIGARAESYARSTMSFTNLAEVVADGLATASRGR